MSTEENQSTDTGNSRYRWAKRVAIAIIGGTVLLAGIAMLVLPGPGIVVILVGLGILGAEFTWANVWLKKLKAAGKHVVNKVKNPRNTGSP